MCSVRRDRAFHASRITPMQPIQGIHHITAFASNPQANADFYHSVLGQRLVKTTVNFDDPGTYHLYYGDKVGSPGTIMTFFPWHNAARGQRGNGEVAAVGYIIRPKAIPYWQERLKQHGVVVGELQPRFGETVLPFQDPDGMMLELIATDEPATIEFWQDGTIPEEMAIRGFHGATLWVNSTAATAIILTEQLGYTHDQTDGSRSRYRAASADIGVTLDLLERPNQPRSRMGAGSIHHIAFRTVDDAEQLEYRDKLNAAGMMVTPVQDRQYFHSIYFREPNGVLFEVATDAPGFAYDEPVESLGQALKLPDWYEQHRATIENGLVRLMYPGTDRAIK